MDSCTRGVFWTLLAISSFLGPAAEAQIAGVPSCATQYQQWKTPVPGVIAGFPGERVYPYSKHPRLCADSVADCRLSLFFKAGQAVSVRPGSPCDDWVYVAPQDDSSPLRGWIPARQLIAPSPNASDQQSIVYGRSSPVCKAALAGNVDDSGLRDIRAYALPFQMLQQFGEGQDDVVDAAVVQQGRLDVTNDGREAAVGLLEATHNGAHLDVPMIFQDDGTLALQNSVNGYLWSLTQNGNDARFFRFQGTTYVQVRPHVVQLFEHVALSDLGDLVPHIGGHHEVWVFHGTIPAKVCTFE